jgi:dUTP pyrophosphatase
VAVGDRIAQLILEKIETPPVLEVQVGPSINISPPFLIKILVQDLEETLRGTGGFGSTGV